MKEMEDKEEALRELQSNAASTNKSGFWVWREKGRG
jgi:hypothetical protein